MTMIKKYTLDVSKWRCGGQGEYSLGKGVTQMLNKEGYMCCLGQFAKQVGIEDKDLLSQSHPLDVAGVVDSAYDQNFLRTAPNSSPFADGADQFDTTSLTHALILINDSEKTTPMQKIKRLKKRLSAFDIELVVVDPDNILKGEKFNG